ncbi:MAG: MarR family transcriptional regulator [Pseudobutyrivibrio sp.]|nr:MarR family transcriptional regulator [Pseudobutyrivibrio sp.]
MKLEWMGEYRDVVEALIHYCNIYAAAYKPEKMEYKGITYSYAQIQVIEYLLENEERHEHMAVIANRLGITRSNFSKIVSRLCDKKLLEKNYQAGSQKNMEVTVLPLGRELYEDYSKIILRWHFSPMFEDLGKMSPEARGLMRDALFAAMKESNYLKEQGLQKKDK